MQMAQNKMPDNFDSTPMLAPTNSMKKRMFFGVFAAILICAAYIIFVLYDVAINKSEYYRAKANQQQIEEFTINANRGTIYDRNGKILAQSTTVWDVIVNPYQIKNVDALDDNGTKDDTTDDEIDERKVEDIALGLAKILEIDGEQLFDKIMNSDQRYYIAKKKIDRETQDKVEAFILENEIV